MQQRSAARTSRCLVGGFTVIELLVVIIVVALLLTVAAPSFLGHQDKAHDSHAQHQLAVGTRSAQADFISKEREFRSPDRVITQIKHDQPQLAVGRYYSADEEDNPLKGLVSPTPAVGVSSGPDHVTVQMGAPDAATDETQKMIALCTRSQTRRVYCKRVDQRHQLRTAPVTPESDHALLDLFTISDAHAAQTVNTRTVSYSTGSNEHNARCALATRFKPPGSPAATPEECGSGQGDYSSEVPADDEDIPPIRDSPQIIGDVEPDEEVRVELPDDIGDVRVIIIWKRCNRTCKRVPEADNRPTFVVPADARHIVVEVIAGETEFVAVQSAMVEVRAPVNVRTPTIRGEVRENEPLIVDPGDWEPGTTFRYQWEQCNPDTTDCVPIPEATEQVFIPTETQVGRTIRVRVVVTPRDARDITLYTEITEPCPDENGRLPGDSGDEPGHGDPGEPSGTVSTAFASAGISNGLTVAPSGDLYFVDNFGMNVRRYDPETRTTEDVAGNGGWDTTAVDGVQATRVPLGGATGLAVAQDGSVYIAEFNGARVRKVSPDGIISTIAGYAPQAYRSNGGNGGPAVRAYLGSPVEVDVSNGRVYIADTYPTNVDIRVIDSNGIISRAAGGGASAGDDIPATSANINAPISLSVARNGDIYFVQRSASSSAHRVRRVSADTGNVTTVISHEYLTDPRGVAVDDDGTVYVTDYAANTVKKYTPGRGVSTFAGNGSSAVMNGPMSVAVSGDGYVYVTDSGNSRLLRIAK
jgi:sugar lactone lactonase YvrE/competence protein ComGC